MALNNQRPDTPLAATSEPQPVSSGLQPMAQSFTQPITKFQRTADTAIQQIATPFSAPAAAPTGAPLSAESQNPNR